MNTYKFFSKERCMRRVENHHLRHTKFVKYIFLTRAPWWEFKTFMSVTMMPFMMPFIASFDI